MESTQSQPKGLYVLFFAEAWERFSYYGMRALLVLYLVKHLKYTQDDALELYGIYTGLVYVTPILGGYLADKYLGRRKAVIIGGIVMALGHFAMAFEPLLHAALGLLIVGNGFFKPNVSTIVGGLYEPGDARRDGGFTIFYMGINLGALFSPIVCGTLGESEMFGWHYGFAAAGIGMVAGLGVFLWGQKFLGNVGFPPNVKATAETRLGAKDWTDIGIYSMAASAFVFGAIQAWKFIKPYYAMLAGWQLGLIGVGLLALGVLSRSIRKKSEGAPAESFTKVEIHRLAVIGILCVFVIFFWMGFEQAGGTMTLFADEYTDLWIWGWKLKASYFQSVNPTIIVLFAPLVSMLWKRIDKSRYALSTSAKMATGLVILGLGFALLYVAQLRFDASHTQLSPLWLVAVYFIHTMGELCLSPIGLSMVTKLSPVRIVSLMMGLWFVSSAIANYLAGTLKSILANWHVPLYGFLVISSIGAGILLFAISPLLNKWTHGAERLKDHDGNGDGEAGAEASPT